MYKVTIYKDDSPEALNKTLNKFLEVAGEKIELIDIKYDNIKTSYYAHLIYKIKDSNEN